ncbi:MAG: metalloregulator ArsR/SmtB family transcription factor [Calditrichia bacterium]
MLKCLYIKGMNEQKQKIAPVCEVEIVNPDNVKTAADHIQQYDQVSGLSDLFKIMGDETRMRIILALMDNELCVCDLAAVLKMTVSAVSHQLRLLRHARLVKFRREGKMIFYSLQDDHIRLLVETAHQHRREDEA